MPRFSPRAAIPFLAAAILSGQAPVKDEDVLDYLNQAIEWNRAVWTTEPSPASSREALLADSLRRTSAQVLRSAFDFARAEAAMSPAKRTGGAPADDRSRNLAQAEATADQRAEAVQNQIDEVSRQLQNAPARQRPVLLARRDKLTGELNFLKARRDVLKNLIGYLSGREAGGLAGRIAEMERLAPEAEAAPQKAPGEAAPVRGQDFRPESAGIVGLITEVFTDSRKASRLAGLARDTEALRQAGDKLRQPLRTALLDVIHRGDALSQSPENASADELASQRKELDALLARFRLLSRATAPLGQLSAALNASRATIVEWRAEVDEEYGTSVRYLLLRLGMLGVGILVIIVFSELWRRGTMRYVQDIRRRRQFLLLRRIVVGCTVALFVVLSFVSEFGSLATFAGFSAAGIAVAMQSVILSVVAYFFLVGRWGVRVGDRVTVSGVTGDVIDIGLFRLYLMELGGAGSDLRPTGRTVVFPNAVFFQPAALFKPLPGMDYTWHTISLTLAPGTEHAGAERRILGAVEKVWEEYRETIERQYKAAQASLNLHTAAPRPESRLRFVEKGIEFTVRYPVEIRRAGEIDDRIARELLAALAREPALELAGTPSIKALV
jgi:small-conductance mechanosensitive channel